jgi:hypothetical protein
MIDYLKSHKAPNAELRYKGNKVYWINKFTGGKQVFVGGEKEVTVPKKELPEMKKLFKEL